MYILAAIAEHGLPALLWAIVALVAIGLWTIAVNVWRVLAARPGEKRHADVFYCMEHDWVGPCPYCDEPESWRDVRTDELHGGLDSVEGQRDHAR